MHYSCHCFPKSRYIIVSALIIVGALFSGCATTQPDRWSEFTRSINFTHYDAFEIAPVEVGVTGRQSPELVEAFKRSSEKGAMLALQELGFFESPDEPDFRVRIIWTDLITEAHHQWLEGESAWQDPIHLENRTALDHHQNIRIHAIVEVSDADSREVFWRSSIQGENSLRSLHVESAEALVTRILSRFPARVITDPALPDIE